MERAHTRALFSQIENAIGFVCAHRHAQTNTRDKPNDPKSDFEVPVLGLCGSDYTRGAYRTATRESAFNIRSTARISSGKCRRRRRRVCRDWDSSASDKPRRHVPHIDGIERKPSRTRADLAVPRTRARSVDWTLLRETSGLIKIPDPTILYTRSCCRRLYRRPRSMYRG